MIHIWSANHMFIYIFSSCTPNSRVKRCSSGACNKPSCNKKTHWRIHQFSDCNCIHEKLLMVSLAITVKLLFWMFFCWSSQYTQISMVFCFLKLFAGISTNWPGWRQGRKTAHPPSENGPATIMKPKHDCYCWANKHLYHTARQALIHVLAAGIWMQPSKEAHWRTLTAKVKKKRMLCESLSKQPKRRQDWFVL